jgi:siroheme synthase-like protein
MNSSSRRRIGIPLMVDLTDAHCLCVGAGAVAERRVPALVAAGGIVTVVAPRVCRSLDLLATSGAITVVKRDYHSDDLDGVFLVLAATDNEPLNRTIGEDALRRGALACVASESNRGNIAFMAVVQRDALTIAVDTAGSSPAVARALRKRVEALLPAGIDDILRDIGDVRVQLKARIADPVKRSAAWQRVELDGDLERALDGDSEAMQRIRRTLGIDTSS